MRGTRISSNPSPSGRGVLFHRGRFAAVSLLIVLAFATVPARAASVAVTLDLSALQPIATVPLRACAVSVASGADGTHVLDAAKASGCITSYQTTTYPGFGTFVDCIDEICGTDATYWRMTENGTGTSYGVDGFRSSAGDVLGFSYTTWAGCLAAPDDPGVC